VVVVETDITSGCGFIVNIRAQRNGGKIMGRPERSRIIGVLAAAAAALTGLTVTISTPNATAQTTAAPTFTIAGVPGWSGSAWGTPTPTLSYWDVPGGKPLVRLTNNWSGGWFHAPRPVSATHIESYLAGQFSTYIGVQLADGRFKWTSTDAFVGASTAGFFGNGGEPTLGLIPIAEIFGLSTRPMSVQAIAYMRDGSATAPATFAFDAINNPSPTDDLFVDLMRANGPRSTSVHTTPWGCATLSSSDVTTTCAWGGFGIERRSRDWSFQRAFPAAKFACALLSSNAATDSVFKSSGALVTFDNTSTPLVLGQNFFVSSSYGTPAFRFTLQIPAGTRQVGMVFEKPVNFRYGSDVDCTITTKDRPEPA
jgi:hypothetical protein